MDIDETMNAINALAEIERAVSGDVYAALADRFATVKQALIEARRAPLSGPGRRPAGKGERDFKERNRNFEVFRVDFEDGDRRSCTVVGWRDAARVARLKESTLRSQLSAAGGSVFRRKANHVFTVTRLRAVDVGAKTDPPSAWPRGFWPDE